MSPGRRHSKRLNSTRPREFAHRVRTQRVVASKRVEVSAVGEHNSPSPWTPICRDQFKLHELTRDICQDGTLCSPVRDCPWPDDNSHAKEEPCELPSPVRDYPWLDDDSHAKEEPSELPRSVRDSPRPDYDSHAKEEPSEQTPVSTHP
jgi:hypothetical protein